VVKFHSFFISHSHQIHFGFSLKMDDL